MATRIVKVHFDISEAKTAASGIKREFGVAFDGIGVMSTTVAGRMRREFESALGGINRSIQTNITSVSALTGAFRGFLGIGILGTITGIAKTALDAAANIDKARQTIVALTGSTDLANKKLAELRQLAAQTPGLTASVAAAGFAQLKAAANISDQAINQVLKGLGRLNAVFTIDDPKGFLRNVVQIFTQGFERADIKEALGRVPIFEQFLEGAFGTKDPEKLRKLKAAGKLTLESFLTGVSEAINNNPALANVQESIGSTFEKLKDRALIAIAPIGDEIAAVLIPAIQSILPAIEDAGAAIAKDMRESRVEVERIIEEIKLLDKAVADIGEDAQFGIFGFRFFNGQSSIKQELQDLLGLLRSVENFVANVLDGFEFLATNAVRAIKRISLSIDEGLRNTLAQAGVQIASLDREILRLRNDLNDLDVEDSNRVSRRTQLDVQRAENERIRLAPLAGNDPSVAFPLTGATAPTSRTRTGGGTTSDSGGGARRKQLTELQELQRTLERLNKDLSDFKDLTRPEFQLKVEIENKEAFKKDLDEIINKTRELGLQLGVNFRVATLSPAAAQAEVERLKQIEKTRKAFDEFKKQNEFQGAGFGLSVAAGEVTRGAEVDKIAAAFTQAQQEEGKRLVVILDKSREIRLADLEIQRQQLEVQNAVERGLITEREARETLLELDRQSAALRIQFLERERGRLTDPEKIAQINVEIEKLRNIGLQLSPIEGFFKGLNNETDTLAEKLEDLGRSFREGFVDAFTDLLVSGRNTFGQLFSIVKTSIARMTAELIASQLFKFFTGIFNRGGTSVTGTPSIVPGGGGGGSSLLPSLASLFGFGGGGGAGSTGGFTTPSFNPNFGALSIGVGPGGFPVFGGGQVSAAQAAVASGATATRATGFGGTFGQFGSNITGALQRSPIGRFLGGLTGGGAVSLALPFLGATLGAGLGGRSTVGNILGAIGGGAVGLGLAFGGAVLGAGGTLGAAALAALGPAALIGAPLLVGAILLGRAAQRRKDEQASGDFLTQAIDSIRELKRQVSVDEITGSQARSIFNSQILPTFQQQIQTLKTASVRQSRLTNQVRDLRNLFESEVGAEIRAQDRRKFVGSRLVPEFAFGGVIPGVDRGFDSVLMRGRPGEMVLTHQQQAAVAALSGNPSIFQMAGVPSAGVQMPDGSQAFQFGGTIRSDQGGGSSGSGELVILVDTLEFRISPDDARGIFVAGARTEDGRKVTILNIKQAKNDREL